MKQTIKYNFEDFVNVKEHDGKLVRNFQKLKNEHSSKTNPGKLFLDDVSDLFLEDIEISTKEAYEKAHVRLNKVNLSVLRKCISDGIRDKFFSSYKLYMSNFTGTGIGIYQDIENYIKKFIERASETLEYQCDLLGSKWREKSKESSGKSWNSISQWIAILVGIIGIIVPIGIAIWKR